MKNRFYKVTNSSPKLGEVPQAEESVMTIATSVLTDSLGASATPPNLGGESRYSIRKASALCTLCSVLCMLMSCSEEQDLLVPEQTNALHITSVTIDGQQEARTRVVADGGTYPDDIPFNQSITGFTAGDVLTLHCRFDDNVLQTPKVHATFGADGTWQLTDSYNAPITLAPDRENGKKWADVFMSADFFSGTSLKGEAALNKAKELGAVQGKAIATENIHLLTDYLVATTSLTNQETQGFGSITIDTDLKSPTLGAVTIQLKHTYRALLRLPKSAANIEEGTYIVNGTAHNVTDLGTLWAEVQDGSSTYYYPLTKVGDYLQAIVQSTTANGSYTLTGFKAVMLTEESGASGEETTQNSELTTQNSLTLDLPFKVGTETTASTGIALQPNYRYPLTLNIAPHTASVTLTSELGKPGWGTDEEELSNEMNELLITVDGTQYIKLDGTATDVDKVKSIIETAIEAGYTNFYVTGATLAEYSNGTAKTVVGEAIRQLETSTTFSLVLPDATSIGGSAFFNCAALKSVSLPAAETIGKSAFYACTALTSVSLPAAETIGEGAFAATSLTSVSLPEATTIEYGAFFGCEDLASVSLPAAKSIGEYAFNECTALTEVSLPAATTIGHEAFNGCEDLASVELPAATAIGMNAFFGCAALTSVSLPAATMIGDYAFQNCVALKSLTFGSVIETVGTDAFLYVPTETCALTLNSGQQNSTDENLKPSENTWAGYTWTSISYVDNDGNAVESN